VTARSGPPRRRTSVRWALWSARLLLIALLAVVYVEERRHGGLQTAPLEEGETWHERKVAFMHAIEDRQVAATLMALGAVVSGFVALRFKLFPDCLADALLVVLGGLTAVHAFLLRALGFT